MSSNPKLYSVTSLAISPENRDVNGVYFLRTGGGFELYRVADVPSKDFVALKVTANIQIINGLPASYLIDSGADVVMASSGGSVLLLPNASMNEGKVIKIVNNGSNITFSISPRARLRMGGSTFGIEELNSFGMATLNSPRWMEVVAIGGDWYVLTSGV